MSRKLKQSSLMLDSIKICFLLALFSISFLIFLNSKTFSNILTEEDYSSYDLWDGTTIASSFAGGDGTETSPYQISTSSEFMYFKSLIEGEDYSSYSSAHYILTNSINLNNNEITSIGINQEKSFKGHFDGNGYSIARVTLKEQVIDDEYYVGLFSMTDGAVIENVNIKEVSYTTTEDVSVDAGIVVGYGTNTKIDNCGIYDSSISIVKGNAGGVVGYQGTDTYLSNLYINATISGGDYAGSLVGYSDTEVSSNIINSIIYDNNEQSLYGFSKSYSTYSNIYSYSYLSDVYTIYEYVYEVEEYKKNESTKTLDELASLLTSGIEEEFTWKVDREYIRFDNSTDVEIFALSRAFVIPTVDIALHDSGVEGDTVYVNDLESSWNYYMGLNYTESNGTLPTNENKNLYNSGNLVAVYYNFNGTDINDSSKVGYVSLSEQQSNYTYYKYYPVIDGYVTIELIDNPFTDRPTDMGFNGWITSYDGATIMYDNNYHVSSVKIPVTYTSDVPDIIEIEFYANWVNAATYTIITSSDEWNTAFNSLNSGKMKALVGTEYIYEDMSNYYYKATVTRNSNYPNGAVDSSGNAIRNRCRSDVCEYYMRVTSTEYNPDVTYYELSNRTMVVHTAQITGTVEINNLPSDTDFNLAGYYHEVTLSSGDSIAGYYDIVGNYQNSGTCSSSSCTYYELLQFYNSEGNINTVVEGESYYYLVTRDTNIIVMGASQNSTWSSNNTKPFTLTSVYNDTDYRSSVIWNVSNLVVNCYADTTIENITISSGQAKSTGEAVPGSGTSTSRYIFGRWNNLKLGRGINQSNSNTNFNYVLGGYSSSTGSSSNVTKYRLLVESGLYNSISMSAGGVGTSYTNYIEAKAIYGSDYDRVKGNNDSLEVAFNVSGSYGGVYYASTTTGISFDANVKSGKFGTNEYDYTTGIYVGGRNGGTHNSARRIYFEGGDTYNLIGGPLTNANRYNYNDSYIYVTGGTIDTIIGGAGTTATYGNRIVQVTGGKINYSVFGGSNGYQGSSEDGTVKGTSYVYVGGNSVIGDTNNINSGNTLWGAEAGSVFGIGNGRSGSSYTSVGSSDNSIIIIDGSATINNNVYGGGNYGATGINSSSSSTDTKILIAGGTINGSVYGGGNNNGSGSSNISSTITINMIGGIVNGSVYGGSKQIGTIYGNTNVNIIGGTVTNVYGGGEGGYTDSTNTGTYVSRNVAVTIGNRSYGVTPIITNNVYGGSAYGVVNGTSTTATTVSLDSTSVVVNAGSINGSVYGGGQGSSLMTPYVLGNSDVTVNGGKITNVFGGNETSGISNGTIAVKLNGGLITNVYGGGKNVDATTTNVYLNGAIVENVFGGGNASSIESSNVTLSAGSALNVYGGSNQSGDVTTSKITSANAVTNSVSDLSVAIDVTGRNVGEWETVDYLAYETINVAVTNNSDTDIVDWGVVLTTTNSKLEYNYSKTEIYEDNSVYTFTEVNRWYGTNPVPANGTYEFSFGLLSYLPHEDFEIVSVEIIGYDSAGNEYASVTGGLVIGTIYGGNNAGGTTGTTNIIVNSVELDNIYGGGNSANVTGDTNIELLNSSLSGMVFGGGNSGNVSGNTTVAVQNSIVGDSIYGGGNSADVYGTTDVIVSGTTTISGSVFGGGNSGSIGSSDSASKTSVNILGATIEKNVYGGCNTAVVYGTTDVNIGASVASTEYTKGDILIKGTVFGGGEANASGSETYDYTFISVTGGIDINIDGSGYTDNNISLQGSIFGSGNASSSSGESNIYINGLGTKTSPNKAISIQRANSVVISDSVIELVGTTDRTNEYSTIKYSFNRINLLKIKNGTRLLLQQNANLLEELQSLVDIDGEEVKASVTIDEDGNVVRNTNNRIYLIANKSLNVTTNEAATSYGKVSGMTFLGMYNAYDNGSYSYGIYDMENEEAADAGDVIIGGSYVLGLHPLNADTTVDGFYSNYINDDYTKVNTSYIEPTPSNASHYMWAIGIDAVNYSFSLTASKYASLGTYELSLIDFAAGNTKFEVIGFNAEGLSSGVSLVDSNNVPKIGLTEEESNSILGLSLKAETTEWTSHGVTKFLSENGGAYTGYSSYLTDNQATAPSLTFYLYHAKNISLDANLGTVVVSLQAYTPINEIEYELSLITITIDLSAKTYSDEDAYDASITYGKKYEMPSTTDVNITSDSSFTAYYSLFAKADSLESIYGNNNDNYHTLSSSYVLPIGTKITMMDLSLDGSIKYYYYIVSDTDYNEKLSQFATDGEATYDLSKFISMDSVSTDNTYSDKVANKSYYHSDNKLVMEEFLFIFDFEDSNITGNQLDNSIILELRNSEDRTSISVLGIRQELMAYNLYEVTNIVLNPEVTIDDKYVYQQDSKEIEYDVTVSYDQTTNRDSIIDTRYEANSMGINITILDSSSNVVSSSLLVGTSIKIGDTHYYPSSDGVFRIKLSDKVSNLSKKLYLTVGSSLPSGNYTMNIDLFSSPDGLHASLGVDAMDIIDITVVGTNNSIQANIDDSSKIIDGYTGLNLDSESYIKSTINYASVLSNPNVRISVYRKSTDSYNSIVYEEIDLTTLTSTTLTYPAVFGLKAQSNYEYIISNNPESVINYNFKLYEGVVSGTYKFVYKLYDNNQLIDSDEEYVVIKKGIASS